MRVSYEEHSGCNNNTLGRRRIVESFGSEVDLRFSECCVSTTTEGGLSTLHVTSTGRTISRNRKAPVPKSLTNRRIFLALPLGLPSSSPSIKMMPPLEP